LGGLNYVIDTERGIKSGLGFEFRFFGRRCQKIISSNEEFENGCMASFKIEVQVILNTAMPVYC
jgi:hypothetical protein